MSKKLLGCYNRLFNINTPAVTRCLILTQVLGIVGVVVATGVCQKENKNTLAIYFVSKSDYLLNTCSPLVSRQSSPRVNTLTFFSLIFSSHTPTHAGESILL